MTQQHPISPPPELVVQWIKEFNQSNDPRWQEYEQDIATRAAQWGADQELEACCEWLNGGSKIDYDTARLLRAARRPKPPSLKRRIAAEIENGTACDRESDRITRDVILEVAAWIDRLGYHSCAAELKNEINQ
jgi:hypothetical protein